MKKPIPYTTWEGREAVKGMTAKPPAQPEPMDITPYASDGPAVYVNRLVISGGGMIKVSFFEQARADQRPYFRSAVLMPAMAAAQLADLIKTTLEQEEAAVKAAMEQKP